MRRFLAGYALGLASSWALGYMVMRDNQAGRRLVQLRHREGEWEWRRVA
jgi:hypothetical protein